MGEVDPLGVVRGHAFGLVEHGARPACPHQLRHTPLGEHRGATFHRHEDVGKPSLAIDVESVAAVHGPAVLEIAAHSDHPNASLDIAVALLDLDPTAVLHAGEAGEVGFHAEVAARVDSDFAIAAAPTHGNRLPRVIGARPVLRVAFVAVPGIVAEASL